MGIRTEGIARISAGTGWSELFGHIRMRLGVGRHAYRVDPGLYALGEPTSDSPVLVTANYRLTLDHLRKHLKDIDVWILIVDTRGINVWCAAGKGTFSTEEVARQISEVNLDKIVNHRKIILPQLSATGVAAHELKKKSGFNVIYGPIRAADIRRFLENGNSADDSMRRVTFTFAERLILTPLEILSMWRPFSIVVVIVVFIISGIGPGIFSAEVAFLRGAMACASLAVGIFLGAFVTPLLLPWIPGRAFSLKGFLVGIVAGAIAMPHIWTRIGPGETTALAIFAISMSSYAAMNFTGSTPFTSPSGVEKEMRRAIPLQALATIVAIVLWIKSAFGG